MTSYLLNYFDSFVPMANGMFNSLWPSDAYIWLQGSRSTLVQVMAWCLTAPSHYLNQCWLAITKVQWCSSEGNFTWDITPIKISLKIIFLRFLLKSAKGQWVNLASIDSVQQFRKSMGETKLRISPSWVSYGVSIVSIWEDIYHIIMELHCIIISADQQPWKSRVVMMSILLSLMIL